MSSRIQSEFTYQSGSGRNAYRFTVTVDAQGLLAIRSLENPHGLIIDPWSPIPQSVTTDIHAAMAQVENIMSSTSAINAQIAFTESDMESVTFPTPLENTTYRVQITSDAFVALRVIDKTTSGFTIEASSPFTGVVGYDVFV